eukprot:6171636-Karenia_brevis.AAC.1
MPCCRREETWTMHAPEWGGRREFHLIAQVIIHMNREVMIMGSKVSDGSSTLSFNDAMKNFITQMYGGDMFLRRNLDDNST